jgi:hypothetical protein
LHDLHLPHLNWQSHLTISGFSPMKYPFLLALSIRKKKRIMSI